MRILKRFFATAIVIFMFLFMVPLQLNANTPVPVIEIKYVDQFQLAWWDVGSGGKYDGAYYKPIVPDGYRALGYYGQPGYRVGYME